MDHVRQEGFRYSFEPEACRDCAGFCCRGKPGNVWVSAGEIGRIASFCATSQVDIIGRYLRPVDNRLAVRERYSKGEYLCVFFDMPAQRCSIYAVRPDQCRRFPFWPCYRGREEEVSAECPGVRLNW